MKNLFPSFAKAAAVALCALTFGSCNRAEYAMLPKVASYHGVTRAATPVPAKPEAATVATEAAANPDAAPVAPVATPEPAAVVPQPSPAPAKVATTAPAAQPSTTPAEINASTTANTASAVASTHKLNGIQRLVLNKVTKKVDKMVQKAAARQHDNTASTAKGGVSGNLRLGIILMVIGALIALLPGLFRVLGLIVFIVGVLFLLLWVLDQA